MPDVDRLLRGHTTLGSWSLGEICGHLTQAFDRRLPHIDAAAVGHPQDGLPVATVARPADGPVP
jgi:hypothetical protein